MKNLLDLDESLLANLKSISISAETLEDFLSEGCLLLKSHYKLKSVSIYLSVKEPVLQLFYKLDENSKFIEKIESGNKYKPGQGFVGQLFDEQLINCKAYAYSEAISEIEKKDISFKTNRFSPEKNILALPLTGENRILGAMEFIDTEVNYSDSCDYILSAYVVSQVFSRAIGSLIRGEFIRIIEASSAMGIEVLNKKLGEEEYLKNVANLIIENRLINYYVAIIRVFSTYKDEVKNESISSNIDIDWTDYKKNNYPVTKSYSTQCYLSGKPKTIVNINDNNISEFQNSSWIQNNKLKSYICLPIMFSDKCLGTLSLFLKYPYHFYSADHYYLRLLAHSIGKTIGLEERMENMRSEVTKNTRATVRELSDLLSIKEFSHHYKNDIRTIRDTLDKVIPTLTKGRIDKLIELSDFVDHRKKELDIFIKNSRGKYGLKIVFSLNDLLDEIISTFRTEIELEGIKIEKIFGDIPFVFMDKNRLEEAISNIFLNAIKSFSESSPKDDKKISISTYIDASFDDYCILISDNGIGIKRHLLPDKIFEEGVSEFKDAEGTGQGLFYSKSILDSFTGEIDAISSAGVGSTFTLRFPRELFEDQ